LPGWKRWTYCNGLKTADRDTWDKVFNKSIKEIDHTILECFAYIENSEIIINYLELNLSISIICNRNLPSHPLKMIEQIETLMANMFLSILAKKIKHMLEDILNNYSKITYNYR